MSMIQFFKYPEGDYRGGRFKVTPSTLGEFRWALRERSTGTILSRHRTAEEAFCAATALDDERQLLNLS